MPRTAHLNQAIRSHQRRCYLDILVQTFRRRKRSLFTEPALGHSNFMKTGLTQRPASEQDILLNLEAETSRVSSANETIRLPVLPSLQWTGRRLMVTDSRLEAWSDLALFFQGMRRKRESSSGGKFPLIGGNPAHVAR